MPRPPLDRETDFRRLFTEHYRHVLAYALRRTDERADAEDVVAGTFAIAWRRFTDAPAEELRLAWLYAIAARVLANHRRSLRRLAALRSRLRALPRPEAVDRVGRTRCSKRSASYARRSRRSSASPRGKG